MGMQSDEMTNVKWDSGGTMMSDSNESGNDLNAEINDAKYGVAERQLVQLWWVMNGDGGDDGMVGTKWNAANAMVVGKWGAGTMVDEAK